MDRSGKKIGMLTRVSPDRSAVVEGEYFTQVQTALGLDDSRLW